MTTASQSPSASTNLNQDNITGNSNSRKVSNSSTLSNMAEEPLVIRTDIACTNPLVDDAHCEHSDGHNLSQYPAQKIVKLTLNRPQQFNALSADMLSALQQELDDIASDGSIRVLVIEASGKAFCAGHNLKEMRANCDKGYYQSLFEQCGRLMLTINQMPQVVIAKVQGIATAAGCQLVAACDLAIAADTAKFATSGINVGLFCSTPAVAVSRNLSRKQAFEMLITGEFIDADTALQQGLINRIAPAEQLDDALQALITSITSKSSVATRIGKEMFYKQLDMELASAYQFAGKVMADNMMYADVTEGIDAFIEKRHPIWKGK